ncbi:MAG: FAD:protein FMN transferase [Ruminococcus flavefaciens]|nr:FAD:protein FMN transferase [Ruminococcus flavefaciens]
MKKLFAAAAAALIPLLIFSGCGKVNHEIYTNIPESQLSVQLNNFGVTQTGAATSLAFPEGRAAESGNYESVGKTFYDIMTTDATLAVSDDFTDHAAAESKFSSFAAEAEKILDGIDKSLSISVEASAVYKFNQAEAGSEIKIDKTAYDVFSIAKKMYEFTEGYYNPAVYYSVERYGFYGKAEDYPKIAEDLPSDEVTEKYKSLSAHFSEVELREEGGGYFVKKPSATVLIDGVTYSMKLDLGGIGKGYAADLIDGLFDEYGYKYGYFNFGDSSIICKNHYKNGNYTLGLKNPRPEYFAQTYVQLAVACQSLTTSGDDVRRYTVDGVRYCHIIDPFTGKPVNTGITSASVIGGSAAEGDALSTAVMAMGKDRAVDFINTKLSDRKVIFTYLKA